MKIHDDIVCENTRITHLDLDSHYEKQEDYRISYEEAIRLNAVTDVLHEYVEERDIDIDGMSVRMPVTISEYISVEDAIQQETAA